MLEAWKMEIKSKFIKPTLAHKSEQPGHNSSLSRRAFQGTASCLYNNDDISSFETRIKGSVANLQKRVQEKDIIQMQA